MFAIGIDAEDIERFSTWHTLPHKSLSKVFTGQEIAYCLEEPAKSAERFAARWCAKEACFKALKKHFLTPISYGLFCKQVQLLSINGAPEILINWQLLHVKKSITTTQSSISITHTKNTAVAVIIFISGCN